MKKPMPKRRLILLHVPKCGGTSLVVSLRQTFGVGRMLHAESKKMPELKHRIVHGHMTPTIQEILKTEPWDRALKVTVIREPVNRLISHYLYWKHAPIEGGGGSELRSDVRMGMPIAEFAHQPEIRWMMSRDYFGKIPIDQFQIIIVNRHFDAGVARLSRFMGVEFPVLHANTSERHYPGYKEEREGIRTDELLMRKLKSILADDIEFYENAYRLKTAVKHMPPPLPPPSLWQRVKAIRLPMFAR